MADGTPAVELPAGQLADAVSADRAAEWPRLYRLELDVRLAVERGQPERPVDASQQVSSLLSGGRKRRRQWTLAHWLWLVAVTLAGFVAAALLIVRF